MGQLKFLKSLLFIIIFTYPVIYFLNRDDNATSEILIKIDREVILPNIYTLSAYLSHESYQTITRKINFQSDTLEILKFKKINSGNWKLLVEAADSTGEIKFRGNASIPISNLEKINIFITFIPSVTGFGYLKIQYDFENINKTNWIDFENNPVIFSTLKGSAGIYQQVVHYNGNDYKMLFNEVTNDGGAEVYYAESLDGINWVRPFQTPIINKGKEGSWDSNSVQPGAIIYEDGIYKLYYFGNDNQFNAWFIGLAKSNDGINWVKHPTPIFHDGDSLKDRNTIFGIVKFNNLYYMYYSKFNPHTINLATSTDGINWNVHKNNPVLMKSQKWEGIGVYEGSVIYDENKFKLIYMTPFSNAFGYAESDDGINWKKSVDNPIFVATNSSNNWASTDIAYPYLIKIDNEYRIYYSGFLKTIGVYNIGFVRKLK